MNYGGATLPRIIVSINAHSQRIVGSNDGAELAANLDSAIGMSEFYVEQVTAGQFFEAIRPLLTDKIAGNVRADGQGLSDIPGKLKPGRRRAISASD